MKRLPTYRLSQVLKVKLPNPEHRAIRSIQPDSPLRGCKVRFGLSVASLARQVLAGLTFVFGSLAITSSAMGGPIVLILRNGDRISGDLQAEDSQRVVLRSAIAGKLRIPKDQIERRELPSPPATAVAGAPVKPSATPSPRAGTAAKNTVTNAPVVSEHFFGFLHPWSTNWHGNFQIGSDLGFGTSDRQTFYANITATHSYRRLRNNLELHSIYGVLNAVESANRIDGLWKVEFDLGQRRRLYAYHQAGGGYDEIRKIDRQLQDGVGMGYKVIEKPRLKFNGELGAQYQQFEYRDTTGKGVYSVRFGENLAWNPIDRVQVTHRFAFMPNIEDFGDYRWRLDLGFAYPVFKRVTLNLNVVDEYEVAPARRVDSNDLQIQSTVGFVF